MESIVLVVLGEDADCKAIGHGAVCQIDPVRDEPGAVDRKPAGLLQPDCTFRYRAGGECPVELHRAGALSRRICNLLDFLQRRSKVDICEAAKARLEVGDRHGLRADQGDVVDEHAVLPRRVAGVVVNLNSGQQNIAGGEIECGIVDLGLRQVERKRIPGVLEDRFCLDGILLERIQRAQVALCKHADVEAVGRARRHVEPVGNKMRAVRYDGARHAYPPFVAGIAGRKIEIKHHDASALSGRIGLLRSPRQRGSKILGQDVVSLDILLEVRDDLRGCDGTRNDKCGKQQEQSLHKRLF